MPGMLSASRVSVGLSGSLHLHKYVLTAVGQIVCRYDNLHQGLYLGFSGLRTLDTSELYNLWHNEGLVAANFLDGTDPTSPSTEQVSLFNLGAVFATAARDVHYAALHPDSQQAQGGPLSQNRQWLYLQANGPGVLYQAYLKSLDYMVSL